jgi:hypothetical protein
MYASKLHHRFLIQFDQLSRIRLEQYWLLLIIANSNKYRQKYIRVNSCNYFCNMCYGSQVGDLIIQRDLNCAGTDTVTIT